MPMVDGLWSVNLRLRPTTAMSQIALKQQLQQENNINSRHHQLLVLQIRLTHYLLPGTAHVNSIQCDAKLYEYNITNS